MFRTATISVLSATAAAATLASSATAQTWSGAYPDMPSWNIGYAATVAFQGTENQIFVFGGIDGLSSADDVWRFHRTLGWSVLTDMPGARTHAEAVTVEVGGMDRVVLIGGSVGGTSATSTCWWYDPATDAWDTATPAPMPTARKSVQAVTAPNGNVYVFGGQVGSGAGTTALEIYDPVANTWSTGPSMPELRYRFEAVIDCDGYVYIHGGEAPPLVLGSVLCFDTNTDTWITSNPHVGGSFAPMPTPRSDFGCALGRDGRQYCISGNQYSPVPTPVVESYDPYSNTWATEPSVAESRNNFEAVGLGSRIWVLGGYRKIWPTTKKMESLGWIYAFGPCSDDVPLLPPLSLHATFHEAEIATPLTGGGIDDVVVDYHTAAYVKAQTAGYGEMVVKCEPADANRILETRVYMTSGQLLAVGLAGEPAYVRDFGFPLDEIIVEVQDRSPSGGETEFRLSIDGADLDRPLGEIYCSPATPNSTGDPSAIRATGLRLAEANALTLEVAGLPQQSYGYFLASTTPGQIVQPGGSTGTLCLAGNIGRFAGNVLNSGDTGAVALDVDLTAIPGNPPSAATAGDTWHFTYWHRDAGATGVTSNFSDAVRVEYE
ncbi:MAG: kelch repeat-containing protein [Planctomycetota bacterium]